MKIAIESPDTLLGIDLVEESILKNYILLVYSMLMFSFYLFKNS
jgi:hypothetical protein